MGCLLGLRTFGDSRRQAEGDFQDHVDIHGHAVTSRGLKHPCCHVLEHCALNRRTRSREQSDAIELAVLSKNRCHLNSFVRPAARRHSPLSVVHAPRLRLDIVSQGGTVESLAPFRGASLTHSSIVSLTTFPPYGLACKRSADSTMRSLRRQRTGKFEP